MKNIKYIDKTLFLVSSILFLIGMIMIFSASNVAAVMRYNSNIYKFFFSQSIFIFLGLIGFLIGIRFKTTFYSGWSWFLLAVFFGLLIFVQLRGYIINGAKSWMPIFGFRFQPSEVIKLLNIIWFSAYFELNRKKLNNLFINFIPFFVVGVISFLIIIQPDLGTATIFILLSLFLYLLIPSKNIVKFKILAIIGGFTIISALAFYIAFPNKVQSVKERFDFKEPCSEKKFYTSGNQVCNSIIAFNNGGLFGKGLGKSTQKYLYLSESHTDFIFAIVVEELGFLIASGIIILYMVLLWRIIIIGKKSDSSRGAIICYGVAIYIFLHIAVNLLGIMGVMPLTGVPLPFLSYGGTYALTLIGSLTIVQRVAIESKLKNK